MADRVTVFQYAGGIFLIGLGIAGTIADLSGFETADPAYFAAAIAAGAGALPETADSMCRLRSRLPV